VVGRLFVTIVLLVFAASLVAGFEAGLAALTVVGFAAAVIGLRWPLVGFLGIGMICTLDAVTRVYLFPGGFLRWNTFNYFLLGVMALGTPFLLRQNDPHSRLLQAFLALLLLELSFSTDFLAGLLHILGAMVSFGILIYLVRGSWNSEAWYYMGLVNGTVSAAGGLVYYLQQSSLAVIDTNVLSYFPQTGLFSVCLGYRFAAGRRWGQPLLGMLAAVNATWVFMSGSRGSLLVASYCLIFLLTAVRSLRRRLALIAGAVLLGGLVITQFADRSEFAMHRVETFFDSSRSLVHRTSGRSDLAIVAWRTFLDHPFGVGTGGYRTSWAEMTVDPDSSRGLSGWQRGRPIDTHTAWMKTLAENGIPGAVLLAAYVLSFVWVGWTRRRQGALMLGLLATGALAVAFISTEFQNKGLWLLAASATVLLHPQKFARCETK